MGIEFAKNSDKSQVMDLWRYCFDDEESFVEYYFEKRYKPSYNLIYREDDDVVSSLMLNPYRLTVGGKTMDISYIVGVSTLPNKRGQGKVSKLMDYALKYEKKSGKIFSMLMAIDTKIYTRYGFKNVYDMMGVDVDFIRIDAKPSKKVRIVKCQDKHLDILVDFYNESMAGKFCYVQRDKQYFLLRKRELKLDDLSVYLAFVDDSLAGYMVFSPKMVSEKKSFVREIYAQSKEVYDSFFAMIKSHYTQAQSVIIHDRPNGFLRDYLNFDNKVIYKLSPFMMMRILDVQKAIGLLDLDSQIKIGIKDDIIKENDAVFSLSKAKLVGEGQVAKDMKADLIIGIDDFTALYFGQSTIDEVSMLRNLKLPDDILGEMRRIFPKKQNYFNDYV